jgi:hypothetical protein
LTPASDLQVDPTTRASGPPTSDFDVDEEPGKPTSDDDDESDRDQIGPRSKYTRRVRSTPGGYRGDARSGLGVKTFREVKLEQEVGTSKTTDMNQNDTY